MTYKCCCVTVLGSGRRLLTIASICDCLLRPSSSSFRPIARNGERYTALLGLRRSCFQTKLDNLTRWNEWKCCPSTPSYAQQLKIIKTYTSSLRSGGGGVVSTLAFSSVPGWYTPKWGVHLLVIATSDERTEWYSSRYWLYIINVYINCWVMCSVFDSRL